jgi:hypothetical protein
MVLHEKSQSSQVSFLLTKPVLCLKLFGMMRIFNIYFLAIGLDHAQIYAPYDSPWLLSKLPPSIYSIFSFGTLSVMYHLCNYYYYSRP